jgi:hypothetical protein
MKRAYERTRVRAYEWTSVRWRAGLLTGFICIAANAWHTDGHYRATADAINIAGPQLPAFFAAQSKTAVLFSGDPDLVRDKALPQVRNSEGPEHFIDFELPGQFRLPDLRYEYVKLLCAKSINPDRIGALPYAVMEQTQRLIMAFARVRHWPKDAAAQQACLLYAGSLSHYAADLCQPLHVTVHYDGRARADGSSPQTGIHEKVDALLGKAGPLSAGLIAPQSVDTAVPLMDLVLRQIDSSRALIDTAYALESRLPLVAQPIADSTVMRFARDRRNSAAGFVARLYLYAWQKSSGIALPDWYVLPGTPKSADHPAGRGAPSNGRNGAF